MTNSFLDVLTSKCVILGLLLLATNGQLQRLQRPGGIRVPSRNQNSVTLTWEQPRTTRYSKFIVTVVPPSAIVSKPKQDGQTSRTISNLKPGYRYVATIKGVTEDGRQSPGNNYELWSEPQPPSNLTLQSMNGIDIGVTLLGYGAHYSVKTTGIYVKWSASSSISAMAGYDVKITPRGGIEMYPRPLEGHSTDDASRLFNGLIPGDEYTISVRTQIGPPYALVYSSPITSSIRLPPAEPFSADVVITGSTHATVQAIGPLLGVHDALFLQLTPDHGDVGPPSPDPVRSSHDLYAITGLKPDTEYTLDIYAVSQGVKSSTPYRLYFATTPRPPTKLVVIAFDRTSVTLYWSQSGRSTSRKNVVYIIEYENVQDIDGDVTSETVSVPTEDNNVRVVVKELSSGVTYNFKVFSTIDGAKNELLAEVVQTVVPPLPRIENMKRTDNGVVMTIANPKEGICPRVAVSYSPQLPGDVIVVPQTYNTEKNFTIPYLPHDGRYSIYIRCISNNVEGPATIISSTARFNSVSGRMFFDENTPRRRLSCSKPRVSKRPPKEDFIPPDACCGDKPIRSISQKCCGSAILSVDSPKLCCRDKFYTPGKEVCCNGGRVRSSGDGCN